MSATNKPVPAQLEALEGERHDGAALGASGEGIREWASKDQDRLRLRGLLLAGAESAACGPVESAYFEGLRQRVRAAR